MIPSLYHYYEASLGPFRNLSDLEPEEAEAVLEELRLRGTSFAGQRTPDYLAVRRSLETAAREQFIRKGGRPLRSCPHYMTLGECPWLLDWYEDGRQLDLSVGDFEEDRISFTYGDLFPTMRYRDGKPYRGQIYTLKEITGLMDVYGLPQVWNPHGAGGPERYIEVQIWDDRPLANRLKTL
ncbi:hypothetical protein [Paenibacillus glufosinatiresistens]|uniref:hypothetical protein n=1 Tax=Paenibacillus glufosinatiresistens TaxID=3070657 RepID=UPI00286EB303|nr:hypothetical protein [Paenibacillus sp. YX.27]